MEEVEETPWATYGGTHAGAHAGAGMSLEADSDHPWHLDDVDFQDLTNPTSPIPRGRRQQHSHLHATGKARPNLSSPYHLLFPTGPPPPSASSSSAEAAPPPQRAQDDLNLHHHQHHIDRSTTNINADEAAATAQAPLTQPLSRLAPRYSVCVAYSEFLVSARRTMELANDAADALRSGLTTAGKVGRAATGKTAQRMAFTTAAFATASGFLFVLACGAYFLFYSKYMPDQVTNLPLHLQYGYEANPYGLVSLADKSFGSYQEYDISVTLDLPLSPTNLDRGNFMLALHLLDDKQPAGPNKNMPSGITPNIMPGPSSLLEGRNVLHTSTRPALLPYRDPLVSLASRLLLLGYHILVPSSETTSLTVPMVERLEFRPGSMSPTQLILDVQAGQTLQVYRVFVTITAQLGGLRWYMHKWWMTSFMVFTVAFWCCEVLFCGLCFLVLKSWLASKKNPEPKTERRSQHPGIKREGGGDSENLEDVPMTFPTSSGQPPLRYDPPGAGHTNGVEGDTPQADMPPAPGGEADDEYEDAGAQEYEGLGEGDEARDSGIGTSFSERDTVSLRRRTSTGRVGRSGS